ncbi:MAG: GNAT family N-acetyltransferase [Haliscomenobacteraceae bacterium CHB4]|nr:Spermidine/spermine N(1)-acetyltransferase [Saprospiraceae bacterium]MCE7922595.1 GNAT family N-acetyltransferase [Haliscomenobacteraceae bacterium CHB4]
MNFHIRKLTVADLPLLQYVGRATYEPYYPHVWKPGGLDWYMEKCFGTDVLTAELADAGIEYLLATDREGQIIGFLKLILLKPVPGTVITNALCLEKIYLMPAFFGKGAGRALMEWTEEKARQSGREAVWLQVMKSGPVAAYERADFINIGPTRFEFDLLKEEERDGWVMLKQLKK